MNRCAPSCICMRYWLRILHDMAPATKAGVLRSAVSNSSVRSVVALHLIMGCSTGFSRRSIGYVGASDGWQDLMDNFKMDWESPRRREEILH